MMLLQSIECSETTVWRFIYVICLLTACGGQERPVVQDHDAKTVELDHGPASDARPVISDGGSMADSARRDARVVVDATAGRDARPHSDGAADSAGPDAEIVTQNPYLPRFENTTCRLPEPPPIGQYQPERAFPNLNFSRPLWIGAAPGEDDTLYVMEQGGRIFAFDVRDDVNEKVTFLQLSVSRDGNEEGLLGLAFHPQYRDNGLFYLYYSARGAACNGASRCSIISEFRRDAPRRADAGSERRLMTIPQPYSNHNGGDLKFGPDGFLYISLGDGGAGGDPLGHGQNTDTLLGAILRIDVRPSANAPYSIPADNPFTDGGGLAEIWAWGLRNVWRMSFDGRTGVLWAADVGQNAYEEINKITGPGNFGWKIREGQVCFNANNCVSEGLVPPVHVYGRAQGESITGGLVYQGSRLPALWGQYLFADFDSGRVWAMESEGDEPRDAQLLTRLDGVTSFGQDALGNMYLASFSGGVYRLGRANPVNGDPFPTRLSQTGCFSDVAAHRVAPGVLAYQVNVPFWSDGLAKERFVAFPNGGRAEYRSEGSLGLPVGTVLIKTFLTPTVGAVPARRIETRLWARFLSGWRGFTFVWNEEQTDATLLQGRREVSVTIDGSMQEWSIPSSTDCHRCHTEAAGYTLGFSTRQLNGVFEFGGRPADQLKALADAGYLVLPDGAAPPAHPRMDALTESVESRVRARLHVDCSSCHQPEGLANARLDLRVQTPLSATGLCRPPEQGNLGIVNSLIVAPGAPDRSILLNRLSRRDGEGMPPLGSNRVHDATITLIRDWIENLNVCPNP
jgi:uncharacterized repeat protein (TIGR03806 family)